MGEPKKGTRMEPIGFCRNPPRRVPDLELEAYRLAGGLHPYSAGFLWCCRNCCSGLRVRCLHSSLRLQVWAVEAYKPDGVWRILCRRPVVHIDGFGFIVQGAFRGWIKLKCDPFCKAAGKCSSWKPFRGRILVLWGAASAIR